MRSEVKTEVRSSWSEIQRSKTRQKIEMRQEKVLFHSVLDSLCRKHHCFLLHYAQKLVASPEVKVHLLFALKTGKNYI